MSYLHLVYRCIFYQQEKAEKLVERHNSEQGSGKEISMLIHSIPKESSNNSVLLKHPGDDDDEELSEEERNFDDEEEQEIQLIDYLLQFYLKLTPDILDENCQLNLNTDE